MIDPTTILFAIALQNSPFYNSSRTEDVTHASWAAIMSSLCRSLSKSLLPTPQFKVYVPPLDSNPGAFFDLPDLDFDASFRTQSDKKGEGVITDFCVLMPLIVRKGDREAAFLNVEQVTQEIEALVERGYSGIPFERFLVPRMYIPVLVELKRPLSRHFSNVRVYVNNLDRGLNLAKNQVEHQAACLFSTPKYACQKYVILIAAVGEWWTMKVEFRANIDKFKIKTYNLFTGRADELESTGNAIVDAAMRELDDEDWDANAIHEPDDIPSFMETELQKARDLEERRNSEMRKVKEEDDKIIEGWAGNDKSKKLFAEFVKKTEPRYLSEEKLKEYLRLNARCNNARYDFNSAGQLPKGPITKDTLSSWTDPMRVGSIASNFYMTFIREELRTAADLREY